MVELKLVIAEPKSGKCKQVQLNEEQSKALFGKKIGETFKGEVIDMTGYEFEITGGSDFCGFAMRKDLPGTQRKRILAVKGVGIKPGRDGERKRKNVAGNTIFEKTAQINMKVVKAGKEDLFAEPAPAEAEAPAAE
ncbi:30S ribosomal protein S6e [archaeon D22]|nr:30S ribosomal protein S6e [archaeon D22]